MKKGLIAFAMLVTLVLSACGGGKPNLDDAKSIAKFECSRMQELMDLMSDSTKDAATNAANNEARIDAISKEMDDFEKEFKAHHGDKASEMEAKVEEALKLECPKIADAI